MNFSRSKKIFLPLVCLFFVVQGKTNAQQLISYVDPFIGTGGHGHTYPGATVNEDCGQMSAWAVWSIVGLYPANPASGRYVFGSPLIDNAVITVKGNKQFTITVKNNSRENKYIQSVVLNGKKYDKVYVDHTDLMKGGTLEFTMGKEPNKKWGSAASQWP